jgi:putative ABC transport system permease protein
VRSRDLLAFAAQALLRARLRSAMMLLAMAIGVAAVVMLTALGEGARRYVTAEFAALGTNLVIVLPGRTETGGINPALMSGDIPRDLTIADAEALLRLPAVLDAAPLMVGQVTVSSGGRERDLPLLGSTRSLLAVRRWHMAQGEFLPDVPWDRATAVCVIGANVSRELFPDRTPLGQWLRIGDRRFRVIGVLATEGRSLGFDVQEIVVVPVANAQALFDRASLFRVLVQARSAARIRETRVQIVETLKARHQGAEDVTVITQDAVLAQFNRIFDVLTAALAGIAAISLLVAGVLVMNVMLVAVSQRTAEIGLLKALGARRRQITQLFLAEAVLLSLLGAAIGVAVGELVTWAGRQALPFDAVAPPWAIGAGVLIAVTSGLVFGLMPARRAARLDPVAALARKA